MIDPKTPNVDLWRILWELRDLRDERQAAKREAAENEWNQRLELREKEEGAGADGPMRAQYDAYAAGREDELTIRGDDIDLARRLFAAVGESVSARIVQPLRDALRSLTLRERMRLEGRP